MCVDGDDLLDEEIGLQATRVAGSAPETGAFAVLPVWRRITVQLGILSVTALAIVLAKELLALQFEGTLRRALSLALVPLPLLLWLLFSARPESRFARPRRRLVGVAVLSGLCASAFGLPLVDDFFQIGQWLPLESVIQRIVGYTVTVGIVDVGIKFMVLRFLVLPQGLRARSDVVAYAMAAAVGYSFTINLVSIWRLDPVWELAAIVVLSNIVIQFASSMAMTLGIVASYFANGLPQRFASQLGGCGAFHRTHRSASAGADQRTSWHGGQRDTTAVWHRVSAGCAVAKLGWHLLLVQQC